MPFALSGPLAVGGRFRASSAPSSFLANFHPCPSTSSAQQRPTLLFVARPASRKRAGQPAMAANYWLSTQCNHWLLDRTQLELARKEDLLYATHEELAAIQIWISTQAIYLCKRLALRQRVIATACVFLRRFFAKNSYAAIDLLLTTAACVYVAAKVEESPVHIKSICAEATRHFEQMGYRNFNTDISSVAEMEFYLLEELEFDLIVYHPYRSLVAIYQQVGAPAFADRSKARADAASMRTNKAGLGLGLPPNAGLQGDAEIEAGLFADMGDGSERALGIEELDEVVVQMAWFAINDTYTTDLPLMYPPHLIAIAAIWLGLLLHAPSRRKLKRSAEETHARRERWRREVQEMMEVPLVRTAPVDAATLSEAGKATLTTTATAATATAAAAGAAATSAAASAGSGVPLQAGGTPASAATDEGTVKDLLAASLPGPPPLPSHDTLTWLASLNVSIPMVAEIVQEMVSSYAREAKVRKMSQDGPEMIQRLERMREARRRHLLKQRLSHAI
ncbi:RNA polymerase II holoenzyme cyclin-like subunit [Thecaphora frezii]